MLFMFIIMNKNMYIDIMELEIFQFFGDSTYILCRKFFHTKLKNN